MHKVKRGVIITTILISIILLNFQLASAQEVALRISGASTIQPILEEIAPTYLDETGETLQISAGGSGTGVSEAIEGITDIGAVSRSLTDAEAEELDFTTIGMDALVVIVNEANPIEEISKEEVVKLYTEEVDNWQELGGPDQSVLLVSKRLGRSTLDLFEDYSGLESPHREENVAEAEISVRAHEIGSNLEMITIVGGIPNAIGYVSLGTALNLQEQGAPIKILTLDGIEPSQENIVGGEYPIVRELNLVYPELTPNIEEFMELILAETGQAIVEAQGFIPVN
ncbi:phosphate ABC transporter substrate-binding protein [Fuchsiella alkaliacetigena]|uniref:phosphate ABC transporter substrate-binding protein n=1 Tax=Fuchsiella alkaliacetigena TaxID=957042 RepID=UPI00200A963B|nr:phosphate ABC transporter substrate-binding protein [Fuchsiella alkaliacetigena]MCK8825717.1 phosphate ABC transporter substrate-binding protein [Fuchsiella alkaliacetigena]